MGTFRAEFSHSQKRDGSEGGEAGRERVGKGSSQGHWEQSQQLAGFQGTGAPLLLHDCLPPHPHPQVRPTAQPRCCFGEKTDLQISFLDTKSSCCTSACPFSGLPPFTSPFPPPSELERVQGSISLGLSFLICKRHVTGLLPGPNATCNPLCLVHSKRKINVAKIYIK